MRRRVTRAVLFVTVLALLSAGPAVPRASAQTTVAIGQTTLGNVFTEGATPSFDVMSTAAAVDWSVRDYWGHEVATGREPTPDGVVRLRVPVDTVGHYDLRVDAGEGEESASTRTSFALVPDVDRSETEDLRFGMQSHFGQAGVGWDPQIVPLLERIGVETVRDAQQWEAIEVEKGVYDFTVDGGRFETYMAALAQHDIDPLINFGLSNPLYDDGETPHTDEGRQAFARFAQEVLARYGQQIKDVGVYNEPNHASFGGAYGPQYHVDMAREMYDAVKAVRDDVTVTAPELSAGEQNTLTWLPWLEEYFRLGGLDHLDVVDVHPYRFGVYGPENGQLSDGLPEDIATVRALMEQYGGDDKPIWITEMGWRVNVGVVTEKVQAARLPRSYVLAFSAGVERFYWYNFMDHRSGPFGLVRAPGAALGAYTPRPSYVAYAVMTSQLADLEYRGADRAPDGVYSHRFGLGRDAVRVMWVPEGSRDITVVTSRPVRVTDTMGKTQLLEPNRGRISLHLTNDVLYVEGAVGPITEGD